MSAAESADTDKAAFLDHAAWILHHGPNMTVQQALHWIVRSLAAEDRLRADLLRLLQLDHAHRREGEEALLRLLSRTWVRRKVRWRALEHVERQVDWSRTAVEQCIQAEQRYWVRERIWVPDESMTAAIRRVADQWAGELEMSPLAEHGSRAQRLRLALEATPQAHGSRQHLPVGVLLSRLGTADRDARLDAHRLRRALATASSRLDARGVGRILTELASTSAFRSPDDKVLAVLMEATVRMAVCRAAVACGWQLDALGGLDGGILTARLSLGPLLLEIGKAPPGPDRYRELRVRSGLAPSLEATRDSQPDLVLRFSSDSDELFVLGDSKRNDAGDAYFRDGLRTATYYLLAFAQPLGLQLTDTDVTGPVRPLFALFFRRGVYLDDQQDTVRALREGRPEDLPSLLCFDMEQHFSSSSWTDEGLLVAWMRLLTTQATERLAHSLSPTPAPPLHPAGTTPPAPAPPSPA